jgi:hypothetical protein
MRLAHGGREGGAEEVEFEIGFKIKVRIEVKEIQTGRAARDRGREQSKDDTRVKKWRTWRRTC